MEKGKIDLLGIGIEILAAYFLLNIINGIIGLTSLYPPNYWSNDTAFDIYTVNYIMIFCGIIPLVVGLCFITIRTIKITKVMGGLWENKGITVSSLATGIIVIIIGMFVSISIISINSDWYEYYLIFPVSMLISNIFMSFLLYTQDGIQNGLIEMKGAKQKGKVISKIAIIFAFLYVIVFIITTPIIITSIGNISSRIEMLETVNFIHLIIYGSICFITTRILRRKWLIFQRMDDLISKKTIIPLQ